MAPISDKCSNRTGSQLVHAVDRVTRQAIHFGRCLLLSGGFLFGSALQVNATTIVAGPNESDLSIQAASRLAKDGDTVEILPGEYLGPVAVWSQKSLTIRGIGQRPVLIANGRSAEHKAIWVVRGGNIIIENIAFSGARVAAGNGAGIRFERGHLTIRGCTFTDNETGILTANRSGLELTIVNSVFERAPNEPGPLHHLLYVGAIDKLTVTGSRFRQGYRGHLIKSRARENHILYNLIIDGKSGSASYELDIPNGGLAFVIGNVIGQSATTENSALIAFGAEGNTWPDSALYLAHNTLVSERAAGNWFLRVWAQKLPSDTVVHAVNNMLVGSGSFSSGTSGSFAGNVTASMALSQNLKAANFRLPLTSPLRGAGVDPGQARGYTLSPTAEFVWPIGTHTLPPLARWTPGAFQRTSE